MTIKRENPKPFEYVDSSSKRPQYALAVIAGILLGLLISLAVVYNGQ